MEFNTMSRTKRAGATEPSIGTKITAKRAEKILGAAGVPDYAKVSVTGALAYVVDEWLAGRGRKGVRARAEASEPESGGAE